MTYNRGIDQKCAYTTGDTAEKVVCCPPWARVSQSCEHTVIIVAVLNQCAVLKHPVHHVGYRRENMKCDDDGTQEFAA